MCNAPPPPHLLSPLMLLHRSPTMSLFTIWSSSSMLTLSMCFSAQIPQPDVSVFFSFSFHSFHTHSLINTASAPSLPSTLPPLSYLTLLVILCSASQCLPYPWPLECPEEFPVSILWTLNDCKKDPEVGVSASNWSFPLMQCSI
jgi:hypothetical protein